jgi:membrane-associated phospholipid phosphatase
MAAMRLSFHTARRLWAPLVFVLSTTTVSAQDGAARATPKPGEGESSCADHGISTVFRCVGHDLRGVAGGEALRWLAAGGVLAGGSLLLDDEVLYSFADPDQDPSVAIGENLGEAGLHFGVPLALYVAARATDHHAASDLAIVLIRTQVVNGILTRGLKLVPRRRPYQEVLTVTKGSFPSGHASTAFATATVMHRRWGWRVGVPAYAVASFIAATRLQNVHYLSDVAFGAALGIASGLAVELPGRQPAVRPIMAPGVAGISVTIGGS